MGVCLPGHHAPKSPLLNLSRQDEFVLNVVKLPSCCSAAPQAGSLPQLAQCPDPTNTNTSQPRSLTQGAPSQHVGIPSAAFPPTKPEMPLR